VRADFGLFQTAQVRVWVVRSRRSGSHGETVTRVLKRNRASDL
jgi:hypothetical protein